MTGSTISLEGVVEPYPSFLQGECDYLCCLGNALHASKLITFANLAATRLRYSDLSRWNFDWIWEYVPC